MRWQLTGSRDCHSFVAGEGKSDLVGPGCNDGCGLMRKRTI